MLRRSLASLLLLVACGGPSPAQPAPAKSPAQPAAKPRTAPTTAPANAAWPCDPSLYAAAAPLAAMYAAADLAGVRAAYHGSALQQLVQAADVATGRKDDPAIVAALADASPTAHAAAVTAIQGALSQWTRHNLKIAAEDPDPAKRPPAWQAALCAWHHGLRPLALAVQRRSAELSSETARDDATLADDIDARFKADPAVERELLPARQAIEKTWYRALHRELAHAAHAARDGKDPVAARRALGLFAMLRDRLQDRNTPGVAIVEAMLAGDPAAVDPAAIIRQIDLALIKRARKYCSEAVDPKLHATAAGAASVEEGAAYTRVLLPGMRAALAAQKFDAAAHLAAWQAWAEAVEAGDDKDEIQRLSDDLVHWNCAYQQALGIRECTSTADEVPAR